jgi:hypothetical protein
MKARRESNEKTIVIKKDSGNEISKVPLSI